MRPDRRTDEVKERRVGAERGQSGVDRLFERPLPLFHRNHIRAQRPHAQHVRRLAADVHRSHVYVAFHAHQRGYGRRGDAVHPSSRLRDELLFPHAPGQQRLPDAVVYFMRARVVEVFAFEENAHAARLF